MGVAKPFFIQGKGETITNEEIFERFHLYHPYTVELGPGKHGPLMSDSILKIGYTPAADPNCNIYTDLNWGMPVADNSVYLIKSNQVLEHISDIIHLMNDMWRVLVPGGIMKHVVPHHSSPYAWGDPTHVRAFSEVSFQYFCQREDGTPFVEKFSDYGIVCNFILKEQVVITGSEVRVVMHKPGSD